MRSELQQIPQPASRFKPHIKGDTCAMTGENLRDESAITDY
jgi:hypothetical protein